MGRLHTLLIMYIWSHNSNTCECLRQVAARYSNLRDEAAQALPGQCGVSVGIPISRNTDCSR
ncbi:hypothetical protein QJS10_CPB22g00128 [Acorus calamus]|uniref:Bifunctional inhibitor/plant lipid transfer protein/seed storage helical domain-containing protein n=1 Tax=Acorus calamus TaxID=4465 RepID=A0AAV9C2G6_ACOCL|nr:hypothetical protein QJS10_CPB22g00128 [Acorus calamus]